MSTFGSKRLVVGAHYGLRDWLAQRVTAVLMALFTLALLVQLLMPGALGYDRWAAIFSQQWMKVLSFVTIVALAYHAWVGVRDIWMDYVKPVALRLALQVF
ncbi:succinate dehydrogenase, hydrophobic membrane anchor protein [Escherichia coli]|uniref:succinate dehydrogenase, hydrophobic membrane anchor protein n=5 Tax=Pseudomonadota TaxID=1224 RepID=UPI000D0B1FC2